MIVGPRRSAGVGEGKVVHGINKILNFQIWIDVFECIVVIMIGGEWVWYLLIFFIRQDRPRGGRCRGRGRNVVGSLVCETPES